MRKLFCWLCLIAVSSPVAVAAETESGLYVTGRGEVMMEPDVARFTFEVVRQGTDAADLKREVDLVTAAVVKLAEAEGVAPTDITAAVIQVRPEYRYLDGRSVLEGVSVSRTIRVELHDLERYGNVTNGAIEAGVNQIQNVELDLVDRTALERKALDTAIERAASEAAHVATRLALRLGRVLEVQLDEVGGMPLEPMERMAMSAKADDFRPGVLVISRQVQLRYELVVP